MSHHFLNTVTLDDPIPASVAPNLIADQMFRLNPLSSGAGYYAAAEAAVRADGSETFTPADIDRIAAALLGRPVDFGADPVPAAKSVAPPVAAPTTKSAASAAPRNTVTVEREPGRAVFTVSPKNFLSVK